MRNFDWEFIAIVGAGFSILCVLIVGLWWLSYIDNQHSFELKKACIERSGTFVSDNCIFGSAK